MQKIYKGVCINRVYECSRRRDQEGTPRVTMIHTPNPPFDKFDTRSVTPKQSKALTHTANKALQRLGKTTAGNLQG